MSYWGDKPIYQQLKEIMAANPKLSRKEALALCARKGMGHWTNPPRPRCQGSQEILKRKSQIERGFIQATK